MIFGPRTRRVIYIAMAVLGLLVGATQAAMSEFTPDPPAWWRAVMAAYGFLAGGSGVLAVLNTTAGPADGVGRERGEHRPERVGYLPEGPAVIHNDAGAPEPLYRPGTVTRIDGA